MAKVTQAHVDARSDAILHAARIVVGRRGVEAATMQEVAAEAGLSTGALYHYFRGKDELIEATFGMGRDRTLKVFEAAAAASASPLEILVETGKHAVTDLLDPGDMCLDLEMTLAAARTGGATSQLAREMRLWNLELIGRLVVAAQDAGEVDATFDPKELAIILHAYVIGLGVLKLQIDDEIDLDQNFELLATLLRRTLRQPDAGGR